MSTSIDALEETHQGWARWAMLRLQHPFLATTLYKKGYEYLISVADAPDNFPELAEEFDHSIRPATCSVRLVLDVPPEFQPVGGKISLREACAKIGIPGEILFEEVPAGVQRPRSSASFDDPQEIPSLREHRPDNLVMRRIVEKDEDGQFGDYDETHNAHVARNLKSASLRQFRDLANQLVPTCSTRNSAVGHPLSLPMAPRLQFTNWSRGACAIFLITTSPLASTPW